ncbi:MAG: CPBP family intramembrane metalloprotease [Cyclobacteriaceae bacterium]|nr:CPBP family intramembrane metalloprotease [Cyclobacteriaceae bacterium]
MQGNLVSDRPASISLLRILVMLIFGYIIMGNVVAMMVIGFMVEGNLVEALSNPTEHPEISSTLLIAQGLGSLTGLVLIPWYYLWSFEKRSATALFGNLPNVVWIGVTALIVVGFGISMSPVTEWNANIELPAWTGAFGEYMTTMEKQAESIIKAVTGNMTPGSFALAFVVISLIAGLGEELVFRGLIQTELQRALGNPHVGIWLAAAFFSAFHLQIFGFFPRMLIGALVGYLYFWSGNLWYPVIAHMLNNGLQLIGLYLNQQGLLSYDVESMESAPWPAVIASLIITGVLLYFYKINQTTRKQPS